MRFWALRINFSSNLALYRAIQSRIPMSSPHTFHRSPTSSAFSEEERQAACLVIARFRKALDTTLGISEWQEGIRVCVDELELPNQRQGISFVQAILSLPLESKRNLVKRLFATHPIRPKPRSAEALLSSWGITSQNRYNVVLTLSQWDDLKRAFSLKLNSGYRSFKNAQAFLYSSLESIAKQSDREICLDIDKREDCQQEAACGLLQAIDRIEPGRPFASYAFQWTRRRVKNFLMKNSLPISAPINLISEASRSNEESSNQILDTKNLALALRGLQKPAIEFTVENWATATCKTQTENETLCPIEVASRHELVEQLETALLQLTVKQREVLALRFGLLNQEVIDTLQGIARATGISRQQVARREKRALSKLESLFSPFQSELI